MSTENRARRSGDVSANDPSPSALARNARVRDARLATRMRGFFQNENVSSRARASASNRAVGASGEASWVRDFHEDDDEDEDVARRRVDGASSATTARRGDARHPLAKDWSERISSPAVRREFMGESIDSYTRRRALRVFAGTWNANGKAPGTSVELETWICRGGVKRGEPADVVVIGFQEIVPLNVGKVLAVEDSAMTELWEDRVDDALNGERSRQEATRRRGVMEEYDPTSLATTMETKTKMETKMETKTETNVKWVSFDGGDVVEDLHGGAIREGSRDASMNDRTRREGHGEPEYRPVAQKQLVGVYVTVWVRSSLLPHLKDVRVATVATGFNIGVGVLGNKGACGVWMRLYSTPLVFICSHLSAGSKPGDEIKRNEDQINIEQQMSFQPPEGRDDAVCTIADAASAIWFGDLNYRLTLEDGVVRRAIADGTYSTLLASDELNIERRARRVFVDWHEGEVTFAPTYKYRPGTNIYSGAGDVDVNEVGQAQKREEEKKRTPAWCDRVLWRGDFDVNLLEYGRCELMHSDHKPVLATFEIIARELEPKRLHDLLFELRRRLDHVEMASQPKCSLVNPMVDLGELSYGARSRGKFTLANVGDVEAKFRLVSPIPGGPPAPGWMRVTPTSGSLLPGEEIAFNIEASIQGGKSSGPNALVTSSPAARRRETALVAVAAEPDPEPVDAILVVRLEGGRDFFVSVSGSYAPCAFGASFEMLPTTAFPPNVPAVVARMTEHLYARLDDAPDLFRVPFDGVRTEDGLAKIARALTPDADVVVDFPSLGVNAYDVGEALLSLFSALPSRAFEHADVVKVVDSMSLAVPPTKDFVNVILLKHVTARTRAAVTHVAALFKRCCDEAQRRSPSACAGAVARIVASLATCLFPEAEGAPTRRRVAFVGALVGVHGSFIDAYEEDATIRVASASAPASASASASAEPTTAPFFSTPNWNRLFQTAVPSSLASTDEETTTNATKNTGNLIDF
jgi:hypothetical protein